MKTRKHGNGMTHKQVVVFSNRLASSAQQEISPYYTYSAGFDEGWAAACKHFAHELRKKLRECETASFIEQYLERLKEIEED